MVGETHEIAPGGGGGFSNHERPTANYDDEPERRRSGEILSELLMHTQNEIPQELIDIYTPGDNKVPRDVGAQALKRGNIVSGGN
jgi:hypothetical protein